MHTAASVLSSSEPSSCSFVRSVLIPFPTHPVSSFFRWFGVKSTISPEAMFPYPPPCSGDANTDRRKAHLSLSRSCHLLFRSNIQLGLYNFCALSLSFGFGFYLFAIFSSKHFTFVFLQNFFRSVDAFFQHLEEPLRVFNFKCPLLGIRI